MKKINLLNKTISHLSSGYGFSPFHGKGVRRNRRGVWGFPFPGKRGPAEQPGGMGITPSPLSPTKFLKFCGARFGATPSWKEGEHKVPSYRRMPVSRGFNRGGGIPLFSGMTVRICGMMIAIAALFATPSFAEPTELDKKTVASKAYVDTKQDMIPAGTYGANASVVTYDATTGGVQERWVLGEGLIAPAATMQGSFYHLLNQYNYSTGHLSSITANFTKIRTPEGTLRNTTIEELESSLVPLNMLAGALYYKQHKLPGKGNSTTSTSPLNLTPAGGKTIELETTSGANDIRFITAGKNEALTLKSGADNVILYINGTKTLAEYQTSNFGATGDQAITNEKYIKGALVSLELLKDVYDELDRRHKEK